MEFENIAVFTKPIFLTKFNKKSRYIYEWRNIFTKLIFNLLNYLTRKNVKMFQNN